MVVVTGEPNGHTVSESIDRQRDHLVASIPRHYHAAAYFGASNLVAGMAILSALAQLRDVRAWEWLIVPAAFMVANWVEYRVHKGPMHHKRRPWEILYERHSRQHHVYFNNVNMSTRNAREYYWVFFPWWAVGLVIATAALFAVPLWLFVSHNLGLLFFVVGVAYYLTYEWLHLSYHLPPQSGIGRLAVVQTLRRLHTSHHDTALMSTQNFNITFPICDCLFGTLAGKPVDIHGSGPAKK